jgi:ABC-2 type transport system permease protein
MMASLSAELRKLARRPGLWVLVSLWGAMGLVFGYLIPYLIYRNPPPDIPREIQGALLITLLPSEFIDNQLTAFPLFGAAMMLIVGVLVFGSEYGWRTLGTILTQGPGRLTILGSKLLALGVVALVFEAAAFVPAAAASSVVAAAEEVPITWPLVGDIMIGVAAGWLVLATMAAAGAFLATVVRGTALAVGIGLVYLLVIEGVFGGFAALSDVVAAIREWLPGANAGSLVAGVTTTIGPETPGVTEVVGPARAVGVLSAYTAGFVLLSGYLLRGRDVT